MGEYEAIITKNGKKVAKIEVEAENKALMRTLGKRFHEMKKKREHERKKVFWDWDVELPSW